jgi:hypothetical protein
MEGICWEAESRIAIAHFQIVQEMEHRPLVNMRLWEFKSESSPKAYRRKMIDAMLYCKALLKYYRAGIRALKEQLRKFFS